MKGRLGTPPGGMRLAVPALAIATVLGIAGSCAGGIFYDETAQAIRVIDFPKEFPCTPARLLYMDRLYGWGKVSYEEHADTYTITADLHIGANDGTETYFQVGSASHPRETLVMRGNLVVYPYWIEGENKEESYSRAKKVVNRLTLGVRGDSSVMAGLRFKASPPGHTLYLGRIPLPDGKLKVGRGGQLHVYYGSITGPGETPVPKGERPLGMYLTGEEVVLDHARLSSFLGFMTYGMNHNAKVQDSIFENAGTGIINGRHDIKRCVFRNCGIAVRDYGSLDAILTDCVFENNDRNWTLEYTNKGLVCIDCTINPPRKDNVYRCWISRRTKKKQYPSFVSKRHILVEVADEKGAPLRGAQVSVKCEQGTFAAAENRFQTTDDAGRTPGKGDTGAILLAELVRKATDVLNKPAVTEYSYTIEAEAPGYAPARLKNFRPEKSWQVVHVVLKRN